MKGHSKAPRKASKSDGYPRASAKGKEYKVYSNKDPKRQY
jgi:hypothetical protein